MPFVFLLPAAVPVHHALRLLAASITSPDFVGGAGSGGCAFMTSSTRPSVLPPVLPLPARETGKKLGDIPAVSYWCGDMCCRREWLVVDAFETCKSARPRSSVLPVLLAWPKVTRFCDPYLDATNKQQRFGSSGACFSCCKARSQASVAIHVLLLPFWPQRQLLVAARPLIPCTARVSLMCSGCYGALRLPRWAGQLLLLLRAAAGPGPLNCAPLGV